ncbi:MAG: pyridoxamine 5'-phosphate oxidase [Bacteroidia bacterium]|nr:pyridoxamine 5'-phosphate oxidase [Bacteroidia bacterium]
MENLELAHLRQEYQKAALDEETAPLDPFILLHQWMREALRAELAEPNAFVLATTDKEGQPHARVVLLKGIESPYLYFYTNYTSAKGEEIAHNPRVAGVFWWEPLERQLRIEGIAEKAPEAVSDAYFATRPYGSQIAAWASPQSQVISTAELRKRWSEYATRYPEGEVPRPPHWGGYRIHVHQIEFWQGRPSRLHDRLRYTYVGDKWIKVRLAP